MNRAIAEIWITYRVYYLFLIIPLISITSCVEKHFDTYYFSEGGYIHIWQQDSLKMFTEIDGEPLNICESSFTFDQESDRYYCEDVSVEFRCFEDHAVLIIYKPSQEIDEVYLCHKDVYRQYDIADDTRQKLVSNPKLPSKYEGWIYLIMDQESDSIIFHDNYPIVTSDQVLDLRCYASNTYQFMDDQFDTMSMIKDFENDHYQSSLLVNHLKFHGFNHRAYKEVLDILDTDEDVMVAFKYTND